MVQYLEELKKKARELLEESGQRGNSGDSATLFRDHLTKVLTEIRKAAPSDDGEWPKLVEDIGARVVFLMEGELKTLKEEAEKRISAAADERELQDCRVSFLGKKGRLTGILRGMKDLTAEQRPVMGALANKVRSEVEALEEEKAESLKEQRLLEKLKSEAVDITLPSRRQKKGHLHPLDKALREITNSFLRMGYSVEEGPEIEKDFFNFECLNLPKDHPARDMQDSFYITPDILLRTHTSPVQARTMQKHTPNSPIRMIAPGKVFRWDNDATHSPVFHQVEGLVVDKGIKLADLKGTLEIFLKDLFGTDTRIRFRASYFPFTEPSAEVDISFASRTHTVSDDPDWLEILGCGMVHQKVLELNGYDPARVSGFAFGMGIERIAMLLYGIDDLRHFYENDMRFLKQF